MMTGNGFFMILGLRFRGILGSINFESQKCFFLA